MGIEDCETRIDLLLFYIGVYPVIDVLIAVGVAIAFVVLLVHFFMANNLILLSARNTTQSFLWRLCGYMRSSPACCFL